VKLQELDEAVGISSEWVYQILIDKLDMKNLPGFKNFFKK
jgi:hypothetical protein